MLLLTCDDGPLAGARFELEGGCPDPVRLVRATDGTVAILDAPDDRPEPNETVHWYRLAPELGHGHLCVRRTRRCWTTVALTHLPALRDLDDGRRVRQLEMPV